MKILITGGTGFLGKATALRLKSLGHEVAVIGRNQKAGSEVAAHGIEFIKADLSERDNIIAACKGCEIVIHCAALASPWGEYDVFYQANVIGTRNVLAGCKAHRIRRLVNISTPSIYFDYKHRTNIKETDPLPTPATHYAATKLEADREVEAARAWGLETISIRPRAIFGPGDRTVLGRLLRMAEKGKVPLINSGVSLVDMTYIDNCVDAILLCINAPAHALGKTYNITNGEPITTRQMLESVCKELNLTVQYQNMPFPVAYVYAAVTEMMHKLRGKPGEPEVTKYAVGLMSKSQTLDITAARQDLGYAPKVTLREGFRRLADWWRSQGAAK